jgi:DNA-binding HxlR family transcriptional regulator
MQRKSFGNMPCPIARSLERVGEWWSILILRDALHGMTRFDQFRKSLGIAPNMLARRLDTLVEAGLLARRRYSVHPPRDDYVLTARGRDFRPVLVSLLAWGNRHFAPEGASVLLIDSKTVAPADPILVDRVTGRPVASPDFAFAAGPAAPERTRRRYATSSTQPGAGDKNSAPEPRKPAVRKNNNKKNNNKNKHNVKSASRPKAAP